MTAGLRRLVVAMVLVATGTGLGACTSPRNALGTPAGRCFKALPAARAAVHGRGRYDGVRYVSVTDFATALHRIGPLLRLIGVTRTRLSSPVCVVAYTGSFAAGSVTAGIPPHARGGFAFVVVRAGDERVVATVVLKRPPLRLTKLDSFEW